MEKMRATRKDGFNPFAIHPRVQTAYDDFLAASTLAPRPVHRWLQPYLSWRWQQRRDFPQLAQVRNANEHDRALLLEFNQIFLEQGEAMLSTTGTSLADLFSAVGKSLLRGGGDSVLLSKLEKEARTIFEIARKAAPTPAALHTLFDGYVHDSLAGFNMQSVEGGGHWRYRKAFRGSNNGLTASHDQIPSSDIAVA